MADLIPNDMVDILPPVDVSPQHSKNTAQYLGSMASATNAILDNIAVPSTPAQWQAAMSTDKSEKAQRQAFALEEARRKGAAIDALAKDAIIGGAGPEEVDAILTQHSSPEQVAAASRSVLERNAAKWLVDQGLMTSPERAAAVFKEEFIDNRDDTNQREEFSATMLRINALRSKLADKFEAASFSEAALDFAAMALIPGHTTVTEAKMFGRGAERMGTSIEKFSQNFWNAPMAERMKILDKFEDDLENNTVVGQNLFAAMEQVDQLVSYKSEDKLEGDITEVIDVLSVLPIGKMIKGFRNMSSAARMSGSKDVSTSRALVLREADYSTQNAEQGFSPRPGGGRVRDDVIEGEYTVVNQDELVENVSPSAMSQDNVVEKAAGQTNTALERVDIARQYEEVLPEVIKQARAQGVEMNAADINSVDLLQLLRGIVTPDVLSEAEQGAANAAAMKAILRQFNLPTENKALLDPATFTGGVVTDKALPMFDVDIDELSGVRTLNAYLGTGDNRLKGFASAEAAEAGAKRMGLEEGFYSVSDRSGEWFIKVSRNTGTTEFIRTISPEEMPFVTPVIGKWVQGSKTVSTADALKGARLSSNAASRLAQGIDESVQKIQRLGSDSRATYDNLMLDIQQHEKWKSVKEVRQWYSRNYQRAPSQKELEAYAATRQLYAFDYLIRNSAVKMELVSAGYQEIKVKGLHAQPVIGKEVTTTSVEPRATRIYDMTEKRIVSVDSREQLNRLLGRSQDYVLIKTMEESKQFGQYIIASRAEVNIRPLREQVLNWVDGPHRIYEGDRYIKQQRIRNMNGQETIVNPKTHFAVKGNSEAERVAKEYNDALDAYKEALRTGSAADRARASDIISRNTYFSSFDEFDKAVKDGRIEATPFEVLKDGENPLHRAGDLAGTKQIDPDFSNFSSQLQSMIEQGRMFYSTRGARLLHPKEGLAPLLHPNEIMSRAISNVINTKAYTNYKIRQVDRWVKSFGKYMVNYDSTRPAIETFMYGQWDNSPKAKVQADHVIRRRAEAQRMAIKRFLGQTGVMDESVSRWREEVIDMVDAKLNAKYADRMANITSNNPVAFARGVAFKFYLGMGDVSQLVVQMSMMPGLAAINPELATKSFAALPFMRGALLNPKHTGTMATKLQQLAHKGGETVMGKVEFTHMVEDLRRSGFDIVDSNLGDLDNMANKSALKGGLAAATGRVTDAASFFFNEAEKANRLIAWSMAWQEDFAKTGKRLTTPEDFGRVGMRADAYAGNMNRDGKAWWQDGWLSLPTQFAGHPARVTEQLIAQTPGGFNRAEKARYYLGLAAAYGPLLGVGGSLTAYLAEKYTEATGRPPDATEALAMQKGVLGALFNETDIQRLQPFGGSTLLAELYNEDGGLALSEMLGPSGELGSRFVEATIGSRKLWALMGGQVDFDLVPITLMDMANDVLKTITSYNRADKAITAWQTKMLLNKQGAVLQQDLDSFDAIMLGLGFPPAESRAAFEASVDHKEYRKKVYKDAVAAAGFLRKALEAEEGSAQSRANYAYFHSLAKLNHVGDITGDGGEMFAREVDKIMAKSGTAYNEEVFMRVYRDLKVPPKGLVRQ